jgi:hypothetical protein
LPWSEPSPRSSTPGSGRAYRRAEPRPDVPRQRTACGARPAPSDRPADGTDRRFARRTPDTRHCDAASSGVGKSWLACALGHKACREDFSVLYHRIPRLFTALAPARGDGRYAKLLRTLARVELLILDHWGPEQLNAEQRRDLLEIVEDRYDARSIIITSQLPVERWYEIIGNPTLADAILDRIIHNAYRIELTGDSMRKLKTEEAEREAPSPPKEVLKSAGAPASTPAKAHRK